MRRLALLDALITLVAMWRVIGHLPLISGRALFLTYAVATARTWVVFGLSALVLVETLYLKYKLVRPMSRRITAQWRKLLCRITSPS